MLLASPYRIAGRLFSLAAVITTLDAIRGEAKVEERIVGHKQLAFADRIALTKSDLLDHVDAVTRWEALNALTARINPGARVVDEQDPLALASAILLLAGAVSWLMLTAGLMGSGWPDTLSISVIGTVLGATQFGKVWSWQLLFAVLLLVSAARLRGLRHWVVLSLLGALAVGSLGLIGHAAAQSGTAGYVHRAVNVLHLLSSAFWLGSLLPLIFAMKYLQDIKLSTAADVALRRFSGLGHYAVAIALATGVANT